MEKTKRARILVADDEEKIRRIIRLSLQIKGYEVECVPDGLSALNAITHAVAVERLFDLLICDIQMPCLSGEQLISKLQELDIELPILAITGYGEKNLVVRLMQAGCRDFLDKPFNGEAIEHKIECILARKRIYSKKFERMKRLSYVGHHARSIAHDLNNILCGVLGYAEMALESVTRNSQASASTKFIEKMCNSASLAVKIGTSLLSPNDESAAVKPELLQTSGSAVVNHAASVLKGIVPETIRVHVKTQDIWFPADSFQLQRAIMNLAFNAINAMPAGGTIALSLTTGSGVRPDGRENGDCARISVSDSGPGIDENIRHKLFDDGFTTRMNGNGIGLSTVKEIATAHDGWVEVSNNDPQGATFTLCIPLLSERENRQ